MNKTTFETLNLRSDLLESLALLHYDHMTPIQALSLPPILAGKDVIAQAKTGSGKTAAFGIGLLSTLDLKEQAIQGLVLCPTRELADQVAKEIRKLARMIPNVRVLTLCGGIPTSVHAASLERPVHIAVGTPGRIEELLQKNVLKLKHLKILVLDEADRMLDMGFQPAIDAITDQVNKERQTLLFSATYPEKIQRIAQRVMHHPIKVETDTTHDTTSIKQHFYAVKDDRARLAALRLLLLQHSPESALVFCNTKKETDEVAAQLREDGFSALALHGDLDQKDRREILVQFANKSISVLVATDVAARGLDIHHIDAVVNYHISRDPEVHVHRIGRTGRAGASGEALTLYSYKDDYAVQVLEEYLDQPIKAEALPSSTLLKKSPHKTAMVTLEMNGGKSHKIRPGDIVGALTGEHGIQGGDIGDISIFDRRAYVAINKKVANAAFKKLTEGKIKGRSFKIRRL